MRRRLSIAYAVICTILLTAGCILAFGFAWNAGVAAIVSCIVGLVASFILAPTLHELGHVVFAQIAKMDYVYVKFFCFKISIKKGKKRLSFASPFAPEQTQVLPKTGGDMVKRAALYTLGGLVFGGVFFWVIMAAAIITTCVGKANYLLWGAVPYATYLFFLNLPPLEYARGKTDTLLYKGIKTGADAEKNMLSAMEIQGQLYEGKSFCEIDERFYFDLPQLCEDEPLFAVMLDLRYRYYLEKGEMEKAKDCLNRLASVQEYLLDKEVEKLAAELTYMHAVCGDIEGAEENGKYCKAYLRGDEGAAKRVLAAFSKACGNTEAVELLVAQAREALQTERIAGVRKFEEILLSRII